jgi:PPOX class probable F420-dependent enzyme
VNENEALRRLERARVGRLATADGAGTPHVVPFVFALDGRTVYWAVDRKPKRSPRLKRLENIEQNPKVEMVTDHYAEDWTSLWWVRATGEARVVEDDRERARALELLTAKYDQYRREPPTGPVVAIDLARVIGWEARPQVR